MPRGVRIRACTCLALDPHLLAGAAQAALAENPNNHPTGNLDHPAALHMIGKTWSPGRVLNVRFLDGTPAQMAKVQRWLVEWSSICSIGFAFGQAGAGDIRVTFTPGGSWSLIGTDCLMVERGAATLQLGWVTDSSDDASDRAVILHEFGHALGLAHEQSHPDEDIKWDRAKAIAWFQRTQGWDLQTIEDNVFAQFDRSQVAGTTYDRTSIMQYPVPAELTLDGRGIGFNTDLSPLDKEHISGIYPPSTPTVGPPTVPVVVVPPAPTSPLPAIVIDGEAAASAIPSPGFPARFTMAVPGAQVVFLTVVAERSHQRPITARVLTPPPSGVVLQLGIPAGGGAFLFQPGTYEIDVFHPLATAVGRVWVEAESQ